MTVLGIETSTKICGVGLADESGIIRERSIEEEHIHSEKLLTLVEDLLAESKRKLQELDAVAISIGPGSFTGLRIGLSTAKGLCYALDRRLVTVPTFAAIAAVVVKELSVFQSLLILMDAKKKECYVGRYALNSGTAVAQREVHVAPYTEATADLGQDRSLVVLSDRCETLRGVLPQTVMCQDLTRYCKAGMVASMGVAKAQQKEYADIPAVEPHYLKDFVAKMSTTAPS